LLANDDYELTPVLKRATLDDYVQLFRSVYGDVPKLRRDYLQWLYLDNPLGPAVGIDAFRGDELAAHYVTVPRQFMSGTTPIRGILSVNTATHPSHQRRGLFKRTAVETYELASSLGFDVVMGVANSQSIHAFETSLGFDNLGQVKLGLSAAWRQSNTLELASLDMSDSWVDWRLKQPIAQYSVFRQKSRFFAFTTMKRIPVCLGEVTSEQAERSGLLVKGGLPFFFLSPEFPVESNRLVVPQKIVPSPWHVILKTLDANAALPGYPHLRLNGLATDTF